jgi:glycosyltransferase involved in cell wall biosynthesis
VKRTAAQLGLGSRLLFAGARDDVPAVMAAIDVLVHPSDQESFGRVVVEAMAAGKPVVGAASGGVGEIIQHGRTGFTVPDNDAERFAAACRELLENSDRRRELGQNGRAYAQENFSIEAVADRVATLYAGLA